MAEAVQVGIYGAAGYAGQDAVALLSQHPAVEIRFATSNTDAGQPVPHTDLRYVPHDDADLNTVDTVLLALPHGASAAVAMRARSAGVRVIDLSADCRLDTVEAYARWYGGPHPHPDLLAAPYGLVEINRAMLGTGDVVAVPGCYPTATLLGLYPILKVGALQAGAPIVIDAKSGVTGAGRTPKPHLHFPEVFGNVTPYAPGRSHRHIGEIEQEIGKLADSAGPVIFTPHLLPVARGLMTSITVTLHATFGAAAAQPLYEEIYGEEPLIMVLPPGEQAALAHVVRTDVCAISLTPIDGRYLHITSVIDNIGKGAAGQAVQNFNLMHNFPETTALRR
jgi:N-acetyl-gamma-glutamyl-phosphate reductase